MFHRYQCQVCHSWVFYDEWDRTGAGQWWHKADKNAIKVWDGSEWVIADAEIRREGNTR
jgi:hypothetical protein